MKTARVSDRLVRQMVAYYGSIEVARNAYRTLRPNAGEGQVLVVLGGRICIKESAEIQYDRSPDAYNVLPK